MIVEEVAQCLREYADALGQDWMFIDGRDVKLALRELATATTKPEAYELARMRRTLATCPDGRGHWTEHCTKECKGGGSREVTGWKGATDE